MRFAHDVLNIIIDSTYIPLCRIPHNRLVGREAPIRGVRQRDQLPGELARVAYQPPPLGTDPLGLGVQVLDPVCRCGHDLHSLLTGHLEPVLSLASRLRRDLLGRVASALKNPRDLRAHPLERALDGTLRRARCAKLCHQLAHPLHIGIDRNAVIAAQRDRKIDLGSDPNRIIRQPRRGRRDLLKDRVLLSSRTLIRHASHTTPAHTTATSAARASSQKAGKIRRLPATRSPTRYCPSPRDDTDSRCLINLLRQEPSTGALVLTSPAVGEEAALGVASPLPGVHRPRGRSAGYRRAGPEQ
jgi:hypothetical protein